MAFFAVTQSKEKKGSFDLACRMPALSRDLRVSMAGIERLLTTPVPIKQLSELDGFWPKLKRVQLGRLDILITVSFRPSPQTTRL